MPARSVRHEYQLAGAYYNVAAPALPEDDPDLLFSFVGSFKSHGCRRPIAQLEHPRAFIEDTQGFVFFDPSSDRYTERRLRFTQTLSRSKFVLCPRGRGTSSIRLYETLAAGRVPVVVSDDWERPPGPRWDTFSIRVREADVSAIPRLLEDMEDQWPLLSAEAHRAYFEWFAPDISFHRIIESCLNLQDRGALISFPSHGLRSRRFYAVGTTTIRGQARRSAVAIRNRTRSALATGREQQ